MKNLLIYTGPTKKFSEEDATLARIQIDNSFDLGWEKEDILVATDFPYEYNGIRSIVLPDGLYYDFDKTANKVPVILYLMSQGVISNSEPHWYHDFDAYELNKITESELQLSNFDLGLTHYTYKPEWQFGSFFFKSGANSVLRLLDNTIRARPYLSRNDEKTLTWLIGHNLINPNRYKRMNVTYNIMKKCLQTIYREAEKPLKVLHFRPSDVLDVFMYGNNRLKTPLMSDRLIGIFRHHGIG